MEKKAVEIEVEHKTNPWKWIALVLIAIMLLDLSCFLGAMAGGMAGYALGHRETRSYRVTPFEYDFPTIPDYPQNPFEQPRLDIPSLPESGNHARLGVTFMMTDAGAEIVAIVPESPAELAGIMVGDVITQVNGRRVTRTQPLDEHILQYSPGDIVTITLERDGRTRQIDVKLAAEPQG